MMILRFVMGMLSLTVSTWTALAADSAPTTTPPADKTKQDKLLAAFIFVGAADRGGWTQPHDEGRLAVEKDFKWVDTAYVENVQEGMAKEVMTQLAQKGFKVIFATHGGFKWEVRAVARKFPEVIFVSALADQTYTNVAIYNPEFYQAFYLNGMMAAALSKTGKLGFIATQRLPAVMRNVNAFALGARLVNPKAEVHVRFTELWECADKCLDYGEELIKLGADVLAHNDYTTMTAELGAKHKIPVFSHYASAFDKAPKQVVSGQLVHWEKIYKRFLEKVRDGRHTAKTMKGVHYWDHLSEGTVELGVKSGMPINPIFEPALKKSKFKDPLTGKEVSVYDAVMSRLAVYKKRTATSWQAPFVGPLNDQSGTVRIKHGAALNFPDLMKMDWLVEGVVDKAQ